MMKEAAMEADAAYDRNREITERYLHGETDSTLARDYEISRARVRQIAHSTIKKLNSDAYQEGAKLAEKSHPAQINFTPEINWLQRNKNLFIR